MNIVVYRALRRPVRTLQAFFGIGRHQTESEEAGAKYRGLLEAAPDAMVVVNQGGEIVLLNVQAEKQFGYSRDELLGQKVKNIIPEGFAERLIADALRSVEDALAQQIGTGIELNGRHKNGSEFPNRDHAEPTGKRRGYSSDGSDPGHQRAKAVGTAAATVAEDGSCRSTRWRHCPRLQ